MARLYTQKKIKKGFWITVKTNAKIPSLYAFNDLELNCFLSKKLAMTSYKKENYLKKLHATGKFIFKKDKCYFLVEQLLL